MSQLPKITLPVIKDSTLIVTHDDGTQFTINYDPELKPIQEEDNISAREFLTNLFFVYQNLILTKQDKDYIHLQEIELIKSVNIGKFIDYVMFIFCPNPNFGDDYCQVFHLLSQELQDQIKATVDKKNIFDFNDTTEKSLHRKQICFSNIKQLLS